jgi:hypothetical protein
VPGTGEPGTHPRDGCGAALRETLVAPGVVAERLRSKFAPARVIVKRKGGSPGTLILTDASEATPRNSADLAGDAFPLARLDVSPYR